MLPAAREGPLHKGWVYIRKSEAKIHASFVRVAGRAARFARALIGAGKLYSTIVTSNLPFDEWTRVLRIRASHLRAGYKRNPPRYLRGPQNRFRSTYRCRTITTSSGCSGYHIFLVLSAPYRCTPSAATSR